MQVHAHLVVNVLPDPEEDASDLATELMDAIKSVSMEYGVIYQSETLVKDVGDEGFIEDVKPSAAIQVA